MRRLPWCVALAAWLAGHPALAASKLDPPDLSRYVRWGVVRVRPGIELSNLGYDDNIFFNAQNRVGDYTATVSPRLEGLLLLGSKSFLTFSERLDYTAYLENSGQNFLNNRGSARYSLPFGRFGVFSDLSLARVRERPIDQEDIRPTRREEEIEVGLVVRPRFRTEIELARGRADWRHSDPDTTTDVAGLLDRTADTNRLRVSYLVRGRTRLTLDGYRRRIDFEAGPEVTPVRDSRAAGILPGVTFELGGPLTGNARIGWATVDAIDPSIPDLAEVVGDLELFYRFSSRTNFRFKGRRAPGFSVYQNNVYLLDTDFGMRAVHYITRPIGLESGISAGWLSFPGSTDGLLREDHIRRYDVGVRLRLAEDLLGRRVEYSLKVGRYRRDSNIPGLDQSQNTFSLNAVAGF